MDLDRYRDPQLAAKLAARIKGLAAGPASLMEVCGTHTMAIAQNGIRSLLPPTVRLLSGPGCPVCVTSQQDINRMVAIASLPGTALATFGDMMRVPGSDGSLAEVKATGGDVRVVYSCLDALEVAKAEHNKNIVFAGVGFETTSPTVAATVLEARRQGVKNFLVYPAFKLVPPALRAILDSGQAKIDGFILPGHVSAIIGSRPYAFLAEEYRRPGAIAGFEPLDILEGIVMLLEMIAQGRSAIANEYRRGVPELGNQDALSILYSVFQPVDAEWRAIGTIPRSGLGFTDAFRDFDASARFEIKIGQSTEPEGCGCGQVMMGLMEPSQCGLFGKTCTPQSPVGPCMVSSEGACAAWYKYDGRGDA